jgi:hypothetical protein
MDALRNPKKISLLAVAILFLFAFFNLILDAPFRNFIKEDNSKNFSTRPRTFNLQKICYIFLRSPFNVFKVFLLSAMRVYPSIRETLCPNLL